MTGRLTALSRSVAGKRVLVTGAASGMGRATAHLFADEGARVALCDLDTERLFAVVDEITEVHGSDVAVGYGCDVSDHAALRELVGVAAHPRTHCYRRRETHAVATVVDAHGQVLDAH
jgi:3-oxoacyl-[acyl-carrier protein] reductase